MCYTNLAGVKVYLGIPVSDTSSNDKLNALIDQTCALLNQWIGDLTEQSYTDQVTICDFHDFEVILKHYNVTDIEEINGETYIGVIGEDFRILNKNRVWIKNVSDYLSQIISRPYFDIKYTAGFAAGSDELNSLILLQNQLIDLNFNKTSGNTLKSYKLGPRSFTFSDDSQTSDLISSIESIISLFTLLPCV